MSEREHLGAFLKRSWGVTVKNLPPGKCRLMNPFSSLSPGAPFQLSVFLSQVPAPPSFPVLLLFLFLPPRVSRRPGKPTTPVTCWLLLLFSSLTRLKEEAMLFSPLTRLKEEGIPLRNVSPAGNICCPQQTQYPPFAKCPHLELGEYPLHSS